MNDFIQIDLASYKFSFLAFVTAFIVSMIVMPPLIKLLHHYEFVDKPDARKEHLEPIPTMGGVAACIGMAVACLFWYQFTRDIFVISFFFSAAVLFSIGIMDDLKHMPAYYKLGIQVAVALLIAFSGIRITSFNGILDIYDIPLTAQYTITVIAITGITNAFNLIDGIDGLAGGLGFMSLIIMGLFLTLSGDTNSGIIAFALAGGVLGFLYFNFNPARIFMGDTGSLLLGFVLSVLSIKFIQQNTNIQTAVVPHAPVFALSVVLIPVMDTIRVFAIRIWQGRSPFDPDKNHIHHLLTNNGWSHSFSAKTICGVHAVIVITGYFLKDIYQWVGIVLLLIMFFIAILIFQRLKYPGEPQLAHSSE